MDLFEFIKQTEGKENALQFAITHGLLPDDKSRNCVKCGRKNGMHLSRNNKYVNVPYMFVCNVRGCRCTVSIGRNTLFDYITFPLSKALRLIYFWLLRISVKDSSHQLQLPESTVTEWYQFFMEICAFIIINFTQAIGGSGHTVDIHAYELQTKEEAYDLWIFTGVDRNTGQNFAIHVDDLDCETLWPIVKNYIMPGTVVVTENCHKFMKKEKSLENGSLKFVHPSKYIKEDTHYHLDEMWNALTQYVNHNTLNSQFTCKELHAYEFLYFNRDGFCNKSASELILPFLSDIKQAYPGFEKVRRTQLKTTHEEVYD